MNLEDAAIPLISYEDVARCRPLWPPGAPYPSSLPAYQKATKGNLPALAGNTLIAAAAVFRDATRTCRTNGSTSTAPAPFGRLILARAAPGVSLDVTCLHYWRDHP